MTVTNKVYSCLTFSTHVIPKPFPIFFQQLLKWKLIHLIKTHTSQALNTSNWTQKQGHKCRRGMQSCLSITINTQRNKKDSTNMQLRWPLLLSSSYSVHCAAHKCAINPTHTFANDNPKLLTRFLLARIWSQAPSCVFDVILELNWRAIWYLGHGPTLVLVGSQI